MIPEAHLFINLALLGSAFLLHIIVLINHISKGNKDAAIGWLVAFVWCVMSFKT
jgi:hypothetical protein